MLSDIQRLADQLPPSSQVVALHVFHSVSTGQITCEETRSSLALTAGLRDVVDAGNLAALLVREPEALASIVKLIGFADARCRNAIGNFLSSQRECVTSLAASIGLRSISHSRRINGIFRHAINYAQNI